MSTQPYDGAQYAREQAFADAVEKARKGQASQSMMIAAIGAIVLDDALRYAAKSGFRPKDFEAILLSALDTHRKIANHIKLGVVAT